MKIKRILYKGIAFCLCLVLAFSSSLSAHAPVVAETDDPVAAYEAKLKAAEEKKSELEQQKKDTEKLIEQFTEEKENLEAYIEELDLKMNDISLKLFDLKNDIESTEEELEQTKLDLEEAKQQEADQYETMKRRIAYVYENDEPSYFEVLLNSASVSDFLNQVEYLEGITRYDNSLLEKYQDAKEKVSQHQKLLEASLAELETMKESELLEQATVSELMELKAAEIERVSEELGVADEYLFNYIEEISSQELTIEEIIEEEQERIAEEERKRQEEEERKRQEEEERKRQEEEERKRQEEEEKSSSDDDSEKITPPSSTAGYDSEAINSVVLTDVTDPDSMIWPLPGDHRTYSKFGPRKAPTAGASTYHKGWDIGGEFGAPMVSVLAGTVYTVGYNSSAGNFVKIEHQPGFITVYCHCSKILVSEGDYVQQGQQIALVGSTGVSTGPHLHFAVSVDGEYTDPDPYIGDLE